MIQMDYYNRIADVKSRFLTSASLGNDRTTGHRRIHGPPHLYLLYRRSKGSRMLRSQLEVSHEFMIYLEVTGKMKCEKKRPTETPSMASAEEAVQKVARQSVSLETVRLNVELE